MTRRSGSSEHSAAGRQIRVAIVESDVAVREQVRRLLERSTDMDLVGAGGTNGDAIALATCLAPDLMVVGVRPPDLDGLGAIATVPGTRRPALVFVASCEDYAYRAFELQAVDYLLSPLDAERFERAMWRVRRELMSEGARLMSVLSSLRDMPTSQRRLMIKSAGQLTFVDLEEIDWIESIGNNVRVHAGAAAYVTRQTMDGLEARLDSRFLRVHRSVIVNTTRIRRICTRSERAWLELKDGREVPAGRYLNRHLTRWMNEAG